MAFLASILSALASPPTDDLAEQLSASESALLQEIAALRRAPAAYADVIERRLEDFDGTVLRQRDGFSEQTREGSDAVREAIRVLRETAPLPALEASSALCRAAADHAADIGSSGRVSHQGSDGSYAMERVRRHADSCRAVAEAISFGQRAAASIVFQLLVDDGIPDRSHRRTLLAPDYTAIGVATRAHATYGTVSVIVVAR